MRHSAGHGSTISSNLIKLLSPLFFHSFPELVRCLPDCLNLGWLYTLLLTNDASQGPKQGITEILRQLVKSGISLYCRSCGDCQNLSLLKQTMANILSATNGYPPKHAKFESRLKAYQNLVDDKLLPPSHYCLYDAGTKLCLSLINSGR